jgi:Uncharacterised nucleotidyltransferase
VLGRRRLPPEQMLPLRAALLPAPQAEDAFAEWRSLVDFEATGSPAYRLLPLIYKNLSSGPETDPVLGRMRGVYRRTWVLNQIQLQAGERAVAVLGEHDIPTMLLKGAAMIARWTGDPGVRMMADFDVLVPRERALEALELLRSGGWAPAVDRSGPLTEDDLEEEHALLMRHDGGGELDLHWRALMHGAGRASDEALWDRAEEIGIGGVGTRVPAPEDHVHHACSHATTWTAAGRVDWIADSGLIVRAVGPRFDWSRVMDLARLDRSEVAVSSLTGALTDVLGEPVPARSSGRRLRISRPAIAERIEISLRGRMPHELGTTAELFLDLQSHRRRKAERLQRPLIASIPSFARERWHVEGLSGLAAQAAYAGLGRPRWLREALVRRVRTHEIAAGDLVTVDTGSLDLRTDGAVRSSLVSGWSFAESEGRWTDGAEATLALRRSTEEGDLAIDVTALPLLHTEHPVLDVEIWANDRRIDTWGYRLDQEAPASRRLIVPEHSLAHRDVLELGFVFRDPCRPMELGLSDDPRRLGLFVRELRFSHA